MDTPTFQQQELPLPFPELSGDQPLLPARMINEYVYCPRLAYLEWVQGEWDDSADTVQGRHVHRRVDRQSGKLPESPDEDERIHARSITLSSNRLGLIARMDLVEGEGSEVVPVDYKRGKRPHVPKGAYDPERVQLCVQGLLLREHGYQCDEGVLYFAGSRERVRVAFDEELEGLTLSAINGLRMVAAAGRIPPPLEDSPKCPRCSLVGICLPDEVNFLRQGNTTLRPIAVVREESVPLYVQANKASVRKKGDNLEVAVEDQVVARPRLMDVSQAVLMGNVYMTTPTLHELLRRGITVSWHSYGGWFLGHSQGTGHGNVELRLAQYRGHDDEQVCLRLARGLVKAKIQNSRTLMRRNWREGSAPAGLLADLRRLAEQSGRASSQQTLLGIEGAGASAYFGHFNRLIRESDSDSDTLRFEFAGRNRRPPTDPVNALLSYAYSLLVRTWSVTLSSVGFDPYLGFYHQPRYGRPALALDLMEPFRPLLADSAVLMAINNGEVRPSDFVSTGNAVNLSPDGRKRFIATFERRLAQEVTHPLFGYRLSYRRILELQARLLARFLLGELPEYPNFTTR
ncbi:CRISPR-associated endonuclease Cas1 [Halomonas sp. 25-S5]|uniref:CRISPR-associated endonuclease Cas4g/Cas1g n=1 Tax=Halomonas sp. 25-S5 TaxID=2994065 RepID=UPI0024692ED6|nr:CRISPR-associated endonuclease Cas1 [Halomonas sp. 25-S5]